MSSEGEGPGHHKGLVDYVVGYGRPPVETRFRRGASGNPRGRPRKQAQVNPIPRLNEERLKTIVLEEAYRTISVRDGERMIEISVIQATIRNLALNAAKGERRAQKLFTDLLSVVERQNKALHDQYLEAAIEYKVEWEKELRRREVLGIDGPEPLPHPDHIVVDMRTGEVEFKGPLTKEEKVLWDRARDIKDDCDYEIARLSKKLKRDPQNTVLQKELEREQRVRAIVCRVVPD